MRHYTLKKIRRHFDMMSQKRISLFKSIGANVLAKFFGRKIVCYGKCEVIGQKNIIFNDINSKLFLATGSSGRYTKWDRTFLNIQGELLIKGRVSIGNGVRISVGKNGVLIIENSSINSGVTIFCEKHISIGAGCIVGWETQIIDSDSHKLVNAKRERENKSGCGYYY